MITDIISATKTPPTKQQQEFPLEQDRHRAKRAAQRKRPGVAHEDLRRMRVVPEEADTRAHDRHAEHRQLARSAQVEKLQVCATHRRAR